MKLSERKESNRHIKNLKRGKIRKKSISSSCMSNLLKNIERMKKKS
jgi:hypothetical protein